MGIQTIITCDNCGKNVSSIEYLVHNHTDHFSVVGKALTGVNLGNALQSYSQIACGRDCVRELVTNAIEYMFNKETRI